ncbi:MAG: N-acetylmuramic acid 6-phosphate etherase [Gammaproteobacteria bacterium]|nr:N-acetylmuramic acid 6-phosphate etherase [Gammaproteobacteria bacterium]
MKSNTEFLDPTLMDLDTRSNMDLLQVLLASQRSAVDAVAAVQAELAEAVSQASTRLGQGQGRLIMVGAGASGRLAVQDGAELWPTYGWPSDRLHLSIAGGERALLHSVEGVEDDASNAIAEAQQLELSQHDVVVGLAASGRSPWTVAWIEAARAAGAYSIGIANNPDTPLMHAAECAVFLNSGNEVLGGSTRMSAGTSQKIILNLFSTTLMIRLNRTYGNLMVDMAAVNRKLDDRRLRMLQAIHPNLATESAQQALDKTDGWVKLAAVVAAGVPVDEARVKLEQQQGSLRAVLEEMKR